MLKKIIAANTNFSLDPATAKTVLSILAAKNINELYNTICEFGISTASLIETRQLLPQKLHVVKIGSEHSMELYFPHNLNEFSVNLLLSTINSSVSRLLNEQIINLQSTFQKLTSELHNRNLDNLFDENKLATNYLDLIISLTDLFHFVDDKNMIGSNKQAFKGAIYLRDSKTKNWQLIEQRRLKPAEQYKIPRPSRQDKHHFEMLIDGLKEFNPELPEYLFQDSDGNPVGTYAPNRETHIFFTDQFNHDISEEKGFEPWECQSSFFLKIHEHDGKELILMLIGPSVVNPLDTFDFVKSFIENVKLANKQIMAINAAYATLSNLVDVIIHDLKQPVTAAESSISSVEKRFLEITKDLSDEDFDKIKTTVQRRLNISKKVHKMILDKINWLLDFSKLKSDKVEYKIQAENIFDIIKDCENSIRSQIDDGRKKLILPSNIDLPKVLADKKWITSVLTNLLSNAIKYTKKDDEIEITVQQKDNKLQIGIKDTGVGLPADKLLDIFYGTSGISEVQGVHDTSHGFGLPHCLKIINAHGNKIWAEKNPDKGLTFYFTLDIE
ncbi:MAG: hypothetical protein A2Y40_05900 [Candidatus Margulisbacteria bacterium GWF2_35_9]|nr:MAG: hypothetical protein A2Y40_05900 [Candidatus Margulisbacteria bacterium GWF2_35_9]